MQPGGVDFLMPVGRPEDGEDARVDRREAAFMSETTEFILGSEVACSDGTCGDLRRMVCDPVARALTHLVVEPRHRRGTGRLVPIDLADVAGEEIRLRCTKSEFEGLEEADEFELKPGARGQWVFGPSFGFGMGGGLGALGMGGMGMGKIGPEPQAVASDHVPSGEVEVQRGDHVRATDGQVGRLQGLVIDASDHHVAHVLVDEGHLWDQRRVAIPISAVDGVDDGVQLNITRDEVRDLPTVSLGQHQLISKVDDVLRADVVADGKLAGALIAELVNQVEALEKRIAKLERRS
jgi:hypothetical protein